MPRLRFLLHLLLKLSMLNLFASIVAWYCARLDVGVPQHEGNGYGVVWSLARPFNFTGFSVIMALLFRTIIF